jgi:hypothetical protein
MKTPIIYTLSVVLVSLLLLPRTTTAQMFSVEDEQPRQRTSGPVNNIFIGWEPSDFSYFGPSQTPEQRTSYEMDDPIFRIRYESLGTELFLGYGDDVTGTDSVDFFHIGGSFSRPLPLYMSKEFRLYLPIQLQADLTLASNEYRLQDKFQQSNILIGAGPGISINITPKTRWSTSALTSIGYSLSPGGTFGGVTYQLNAQTRLALIQLFGSVGLSLGYDYTFKQFDISVNRFDYKLRAHSFLIGVNF